MIEHEMVVIERSVEEGATQENRTEVAWMTYRTGQYLRRAGVMVVDGPDARVSCVECRQAWHPGRGEDGRFISWACPAGCSRARVAALDSLGLQPISQPGVTFPMNTVPVIESAPQDFTGLFEAMAAALVESSVDAVAG
jgi:hypothetical protein